MLAIDLSAKELLAWDRPDTRMFMSPSIIVSVELLIPAIILNRAFFFPSPYMGDMNTSKMPSKQYTWSSSIVVLRFAAQRIRSSILNSDRRDLPNATTGISVIS